MQALGRNKASVTQDFHNAGGGTHRQFHSHNSDSNSSSNGDGQSPSPPPSSPSSASRSAASTSPPTVAASVAGASTHHLSEEHLSLLQLLATAAVAQQHLQLQQQQQSSASSILSSPPASHPPAIVQNQHHHQNSTNQAQQGDAKRRRKSSSRNDKENLGQKQQPNRTVAVGGKVIDLTVTAAAAATNGPTATSETGNGIERNNNSSSNNNNSSVNNKNISEAIFDRVMYKKPSYQNMFLTSAFCKPVLGSATVEKDPRREDRVIVAEKSFSLAEFLRNHTEVSISTLNSTTASAKASDADDVIFIKEEKRRKQQAPRKVDQPPSAERSVGDIRDKHMIRLITRRLCCRICQNQQRNGAAPDNCHYHSKTSLILHNRWRHGAGQPTANRCQHCGQAFERKYKLALHLKLSHRNRKVQMTKRAATTAGKKQLRKQRKRKPRSRCFTKRRK
uniref:C2H2-type domain-containing protein n=1 Tax=Culex tarsalis TaxID=7177 RepID=A0A1Q3EX69_CULTA